jgi:hypothetical protein
MAIGRITGPMLFSNLDRQGVDLAFDSNLIYLSVSNRYVGISNQNPRYPLDSPGNARIANIFILGNSISSNTGKINFGNVSNIVITGGAVNNVLTTDGFGNLSFVNISSISGILGNNIQLGANTIGSLVSNAVSLTTTTTVTDSIASLNQILGKLVPPSPPNFPNATALALTTATTSGLICNFTQTDNTQGNSYQLAAGSALSAVRSATYTTNTITNVGPGSSGNVTIWLNGNLAGSHVLTGVSGDNGTYSNLVISGVQDYHNVSSSVTAGFWTVFSVNGTGSSIPPGWNTVYISDSATGTSTNTLQWYYDSSAPGTPAFTATSIALTTNVVSYSSTIPHFTSSAQYTISANVSSLSGDMYPNSTTLATGGAGGAFQAPLSVTYATAGVTTPLTRNLYVSSGNVKFTTTSNIIASGFGSSSTGPTVSVNNSYATGTVTLSPGVTVLYKNGTGNQIEETSLTIGSVGTGSGNPYRIVNPGSTDTPAYTGSEAAFNSQTSTLQTYDATVVAAVLKFDQTNYSTGYAPVGPNLSGQGANQYFTFKFVRTAVSKFDILYSGNIAGLWVALPGSTIDSTSSLNGWVDMGTAYGGAGIPGVNNPGNGSNGCALGGTAVFNSVQASKSVTCTFGTVSSSSTATNEIYVRVKLTSGQTVTALQIQAATH